MDCWSSSSNCGAWTLAATQCYEINTHRLKVIEDVSIATARAEQSCRREFHKEFSNTRSLAQPFLVQKEGGCTCYLSITKLCKLNSLPFNPDRGLLQMCTLAHLLDI